MSETPSTTPIAGAKPQSALIGFDSGGLVLSSMQDAFIFAKAVIASGLAPKSFQSAEAVLIAVQMGAEIGLPPMASLQNIAVINGKPGVYGDVGKALLRARGFDIEETSDEKGATCTITHPKQKPVTRRFTIEDAKKAGLWGKAGPWVQYPTRMLAWRAFWFAARDAAADVLKGVGGAEEIQDLPPEPKNVTPPPAGQRLAVLDTPAETQTEPPVSTAPESPVQATAPEQPAETPPAPEFDKQTLVDLIEGLMLDHEYSEEKLVSEVIKSGLKLPAKFKKLSDLPEDVLKFMLDHLRGLKK